MVCCSAGEKHICVNKLTIIGSDNGLSPCRRQAIIWTNAGTLLTGPLGTNFSEILIKIYKFSFTKMHLKMSSGKWRPLCLCLNKSTHCQQVLFHLVRDLHVALLCTMQYFFNENVWILPLFTDLRVSCTLSLFVTIIGRTMDMNLSDYRQPSIFVPCHLKENKGAYGIVPFHKYFSLSGEQPEQQELAPML